MTSPSLSRLSLSLAAAAALALGAAPAFAKDARSDAFIAKAVQGNLAEMEMGDLAMAQGASQAVKDYGQMLKRDHTAANEKAMAAASAMGVTPPIQPAKAAQATHDKLAKLTGAAFDAAFKKEMVKDHTKDIAEFTKAAKLKTQQASTYASETLPTLRQHLDAAKALK